MRAWHALHIRHTLHRRPSSQVDYGYIDYGYIRYTRYIEGRILRSEFSGRLRLGCRHASSPWTATHALSSPPVTHAFEYATTQVGLLHKEALYSYTVIFLWSRQVKLLQVSESFG